MDIYRFSGEGAFDDLTTKIMADAYEGVLRELRFCDCNQPISKLVATTVIAVVRMGERDPARIRDLVARHFLQLYQESQDPLLIDTSPTQSSVDRLCAE